MPRKRKSTSKRRKGKAKRPGPKSYYYDDDDYTYDDGYSSILGGLDLPTLMMLQGGLGGLGGLGGAGGGLDIQTYLQLQALGGAKMPGMKALMQMHALQNLGPWGMRKKLQGPAQNVPLGEGQQLGAGLKDYLARGLLTQSQANILANQGVSAYGMGGYGY